MKRLSKRAACAPLIVGTYDKNVGPDNQCLYLNGARVAQMSDTQPIDLNSASLGIGRHASGRGRSFNGQIDEFRIAHGVCGGQFSSSQALDEAYVPYFAAFGAAWDDGMVARWSANPLSMLWPEMDAAFVA